MPLPDWNDADLNAAAPYLNQAIADHGLDGALIYGQCDQESHFKPDAFLMDRNGGSYGLMQMSYPTAQGLGYTGTPDGLFEPGVNTQLGCQLMAQLLARYSGDASKALAAYNAGPGNLLAGKKYADAVLVKAAYFAQLFAGQQDGSDPLPDDPGDDPTSTNGTGVAAALGALALGLALYKALR